MNRWKSSPNLVSLSFNARVSIISRQVSFQEVLNSINKIKTQILQDEWECINNVNEELDEEGRKWNKRCDNTVFMIRWGMDNILKEECSQRENRYFVSYFRGIPVGAMIFSPKGEYVPDVPGVVLLVTHPGIRGCGILLMECAVNESKEQGKEGRVQVFPTTGSKSAYVNMGFMSIKKNQRPMLLEPSKSPQWVLRQDRYHFIGN
ncbi:GNAT family N-acetyltransferase [Xenorhabdus lircayensis]|uniref:N-acetyltransferase n=1 Tax=Xenorhabdus lircayensis TaxID=2763499 RepID=A0ABS0U4T6_9GAMM|nr:GNAT family N-acetyltransferase [Xenorhabdus lircayensis]MBI6548632.1 hypothetical protein [Xenorhabdus lircayensis]